MLLVEENEALRRLLHNYLEANDYNLLEAACAADAADLAEVFDGEIDLLVADAAGAELAAQLKTARPEMKVLFAGNSRDAQGLAGAEWIPKPIRKSEHAGKAGDHAAVGGAVRLGRRLARGGFPPARSAWRRRIPGFRACRAGMSLRPSCRRTRRGFYFFSAVAPFLLFCGTQFDCARAT